MKEEYNERVRWTNGRIRDKEGEKEGRMWSKGGRQRKSIICP